MHMGQLSWQCEDTQGLIGASADVNHICSFGRFHTALSVARNNKHGECEAVLKAAGALTESTFIFISPLLVLIRQ